VHMSWAHIEGNSLPLLALGFLAANRGLMKFAWVTVTIIVVSGLFVWLASPTGTDTAGASAVIAGWLGYVMLRGVFERQGIDMMVGGVAGFIYLGAFEFVPNNQSISWQGHLSGLLTGLLCAWLISDRSPISSFNKRAQASLALASKNSLARARTLTAGRGKPIAIASAALIVVAAVGIGLAATMGTSPQSTPPPSAAPPPVAAQPAPTTAPPTVAPTTQAPAVAPVVPTPTSVALGCTLAYPNAGSEATGAWYPQTVAQQGAVITGTPDTSPTVDVQFVVNEYDNSPPTGPGVYETTEQVQLNASGQGTIWVSSTATSELEGANNNGTVACTATFTSN
jgi:hypothetical protein